MKSKKNVVFKMFVTSILFLTTILVTNAQETIISGTTTSERLKMTNVSFHGNMLSVPVKDKKFSEIINLDTPQFIVFSASNKDTYIYTIPGQPVELLVEQASLRQPAVITRANKDAAAVDNVIKTFYTSLKSQGINVSKKGWLEKINNKPQAINKAITAAKSNYATNSKTIDKVAPTFKMDLELIANTFKSYVKIDDYTLQELEVKLDELSNSNMKPSDLSLPFFREYIKDLTTAYAVRKLDSYHLDLNQAEYRLAVTRIGTEAIANTLKNKTVKNLVFKNLLENELKRYGVLRDPYTSYLFSQVDKSEVTELKQTYDQLKAKEKMDGPRKDLIDFTMYDVNGKPHSMDEFLGKIVYIDFWASWCAPCKQQIPFIKKLEEEYHGKDIVFVGISFDAKKDAWLKSVKEEGLTGATFWVKGDFKHPLATTYGIKSIPRFMMLDMEGNIMSDDMLRPSQTEDLTEVINKELYKKELDGIVTNHIKKVGGDKLMNGIGVEVASNASIMGLQIMSNTYYEYPSKIRMENFQMGAKDRSDKSKMNSSIFNLKEEKEKGKSGWLNKVSGLEVFLLTKEFDKKFEFAEENFTNEDNQYVLQTPDGNNMIKVFIGKDDLLLHKVMMETPVSARNGGGTSAAITIYSNYKQINGVYVPYKKSINGMLTISVEDVNVKDFEDSLFTKIE